MRRALVPLLLVAALALTLPAAATTELANYKDKFTSIGWGGSNGSLPWSGPWHEIGDDGDEKKGSVRVVSSGNCPSGNCISISALLTSPTSAPAALLTSVSWRCPSSASTW